MTDNSIVGRETVGSVPSLHVNCGFNAQGGYLREVDWNGKIVGEPIDPMQHHDGRKLPYGHIIYTGWESMPAEHAGRVCGGRDMPHTPEGLYSDYGRDCRSHARESGPG
ncbi:MAG: hypothetical protein ACKVQK_11750 [Burkholderiales bacterium]